MIKNQNIICISSIDWDFVWQGHQEIMSTFAKNGNRVLFIENTGIRTPSFKDIPRLQKRLVNWIKSIRGFREEMENLYVYSPLILPFPYARLARFINRHILLPAIRRWMKTMKFYNPIVWTFLPSGIALDIINDIEKQLLIYYCIADFYELVDNSKKVSRTENELIEKSDLIFVQGEFLKKRCRRLNNNVHIFPFGVKMEVFENFNFNPAEIPNDIKGIKKPIIGYIGGIHRHMDFDLIRFMAETHPEWSLVLIGPVQTNISRVSGLPNVFFLGKKDFPDLPYYINEFDVGIIPYLNTGYTATVYPTKLNEYHALGKPVVSTDLPEIAEFNLKNENLILVGNTHKEFVDRILEALNNTNRLLFEKRFASARRNSWINRIEMMSELIQDAIQKKSEEPFDWKKVFVKIYTRTRIKLFSTVIISLSLYTLVFYTPLVWFMASPLKISQEPEKADCIAVFAGGVGESGRAGQGYEERVRYAVELYNKGYSSHIIFSSGYKYIFEEPFVMKALAVSLGVPENVIMLEDKATNTYENVRFSNEILRKNNWDSMLLISSPYHMRRTSLVFNKIAREIKVIYTPVKNSFFFSRPESGKRKIQKQINIEQIKAILHEYIGILYYLFKGYI